MNPFLFVFVFAILPCLFLAALWSPVSKCDGLFALVVHCVFDTFPNGVLGQVWYLIVAIPDIYFLPYFDAYACYISLMGCHYYFYRRMKTNVILCVV